FSNCDGLKTVLFEEGSTQVANYLFCNCTGLEEIELPDTITNIKEYAFNNCTNLKRIKLSNALTSIGRGAFEKCQKLQEVKLPDSIVSIGYSAFANCSKLESVQLPKNLKTIGHSAFKDCDALTKIIIPKALEECTNTGIGESNGAFSNCDGLKTVLFEEGSTQVANYLFYNCTGLEEIELPDTITNIKEYAFNNCTNLKRIKLLNALTSIGRGAFENCQKLQEVKLPDSIVSIGYSAFENCSKLESVQLPKNLKTIGYSAFKDCDALTRITIPKALEECTNTGIGESNGAFSNCDGLKTVLFEEGSTQVANYLFCNCTGLEEIELPDTIINIGNSAFNTCTNLRKVILPDSVTGMGINVFKGCSNLEEITLPKVRYNITEGTFQSCTKLKTIDLPKTLETIQENAFKESGLTEIVLPDTVKEIKSSAFENCTSLEKITFSKELTMIGASSFKNCDSLIKAEIPSSVYQIGNYAFYDCDTLQKVIMSDEVTSLGNYVFQSCDELSEVTLGSGMTSIPNYTFADCGKITSIIIPYNVTSINQYAFKNCTSLTKVTIPRKTTTINSNAFSYPGNMTIYGVKGSYAETFANAQGITFVERSVPAEAVSFKSDSYNMLYNTTTKFIPAISPADFTDEMVWKSSNTAIATVDENGLVKAVGVGTATIKLVVGDVSTSFTVIVTQPVTSISLNTYSLNLQSGDKYTLIASVYPQGANNKSVQWSSSDENIAVVSQDGLVTAIKKGSCIVTAKAMDGSNINRSCTIDVLNNMYVVTDVNDLQSSHPYENNCTDIWKYTLPGASSLKITFDSDTSMEEGFDYLYIYNGDKEEIGEYTGNELKGKEIVVEGDTVYIQLDTDTASDDYGFRVSDIKATTLPITYTVVFDKNNSLATGMMQNQIVKSAGGAKLIQNKYKCNGWLFIGWNTKADGSGISYTDEERTENVSAIDGDTIVLYAQWKKISQVEVPSANIPTNSIVNESAEIILSCDMEGAQIFYTLDRSIPTEKSMLYTQPIRILEDTIITAFAIKEEYQDSEIVVFKYIVAETSDILPEDIPLNGSIPEGIWSAGITEKVYTGTNITQNFRLYDNEKLLKEKTDYTISYKNNKAAYTYLDEDYALYEERLNSTGKKVKVGTFDPAKAPQIIIKMKGNYSGSKTIYFKIKQANISGAEFETTDLTVTYTGKKQTPQPTLSWQGKNLKYGTDFYIPEYDDAKSDKKAFVEPQSEGYKLTIKGKNNFVGQIPITLTISESVKQIAMSKVTVKGLTSQSWSGERITQNDFSVNYGKDLLKEEEGEYTVTWGQNISVGTGTITFTGTGLDTDGDGLSYIGSKTVSFKIIGNSMSKVTVEGVDKSYSYTGSKIEPVASLSFKANKSSEPISLIAGQHYTVEYQKNLDKGMATIIFKGIENSGYTGIKKQTFKIISAGISDSINEGINEERVQVTFKEPENVVGGVYVTPHMKGGAKPEIIVTYGEKTLELNRDYTISYANNKKPALFTDKNAPTITVKGKGNFTGSKKVSFTIEAKALSSDNGIKVVINDKVVSNKKSGYVQSFKIYDSDGTVLNSSDYDSKNIIYTLIESEDGNGTSKIENTVLDKNSIVSENSVIRVTIKGKGNYANGEVYGTYRILEKNHDINKAIIQIADQKYTGMPTLILNQNQFKTGKVYIKMGDEMRELILGEDIEVVPESYVNHVNKGTAKVTFRGINEFGGSKTVSYKIGVRSVEEFWKGVQEKVANFLN
ncbi:MAG: leucine-rich repeat protein, partial [Lachnospiraceae bacterium]|nr:leucine-rich repeat protein [Lachnospiraceae bacterium]